MRWGAVLLAVVALTGCGGNDGGGDSGTDLEAAVRAYTEAFGSGDPDAAVALLTDRCEQDAGEVVRAAVDQIAGQAPGLEVTSYPEEVDGDAATVDYETSDPAYSQHGERWIVEDGDWRNDDC